MATKREQIIDLINDYIYTNGRQRITAVQLNDILTVMANSFEVVGEGTGGGINQVLNTDPNVDDNQKIINANGGQFELSGMIDFNEEISVPYIGFITTQEGTSSIPDKNLAPAPDTPKIGGVISNQIATVIGNIDGFNPFDLLGEANNPLSKIQNRVEITEQKKRISKEEGLAAEPTQTAVLSFYLPDSIYYEKAGLDRGLYSLFIQDRIQNSIEIKEDKIGISTYSDYSDRTEDKRVGSIDVWNNVIQQKVATSREHAREILKSSIKTFEFNEKTALAIAQEGIAFYEGTRISYMQDAGSAGVAVLVAGEVTVNTFSINSNSHILLTVQDEGEFQGNIRVSSKSYGSGFTISSTNNTDSCNVFWQIIDIL